MKSISAQAKQMLLKECSEANHIPYMRHASPEVIKSFNGDYLMCIRVSGMPHETQSDSELDRASRIRKALLNSFAGKPVQFYTHVIRRKIKIKKVKGFDNQFLNDVSKGYNRKFGNKNFYINEIYISVVRLNSRLFYKQHSTLLDLVDKVPVLEKIKLVRKVVDEARSDDKYEISILEEINDYKNKLLGALKKYSPSVLTIKESNDLLWSEPMTFLGYLINKTWKPYKLPGGPINGYLPINRKFFGHKKLALQMPGGNVEGVLLTIKNYCNHTFAGMLDNLTALNCELVLTMSFQPMDKTKAKKHVTRTSARMSFGDDAVTLRKDLKQFTDSLASGDEVMGTNHITVFLYHEDSKVLDEAVGLAINELTSIGIDAQVDPLNLECAFWAQLPGNKAYIARKGDITSFNFADFSSLHNTPIGKPKCKWGDHIMTLTTTSGTPYHFNWHYGDIGIVSVIGGTGAGKTVAMSMGIAMSMKHNPKVFYMDMKEGAKIFIKAMNGQYLSMKPGVSTGWNPLQVDDNRANRDFINNLLMMILKGPGETELSSTELTVIDDLVDAIFSVEKEIRQLRTFEPYISGSELHTRIESFKRWITDEMGRVGRNAWVFDNPTNETFINDRVVGMDMTHFIDDEEIRGPVFHYQFHSILQSLDGQPVIINIDEAWKAFQDPIFAKQIEEWARTIRRDNGVLIVGTQKASDASNNLELVEQSKTEIFFPNSKATREDYKPWGLSDREIDLIRKLPPERRFFLLRTPDGSVIVKLDLTGMEDQMAVFSGRKETINLVDHLIEKHGDDSSKWLPEFYARYKS
jgi:type IV secretion system protein VirB4